MVQHNLFADESRLKHDKTNFFYTTAVPTACYTRCRGIGPRWLEWFE